jgi:hypothetical protein
MADNNPDEVLCSTLIKYISEHFGLQEQMSNPVNPNKNNVGYDFAVGYNVNLEGSLDVCVPVVPQFPTHQYTNRTLGPHCASGLKYLQSLHLIFPSSGTVSAARRERVGRSAN